MTGSSTKQAGAPRWSALQRWTLGVTSMAAFMAGMDALVVTTALPTIHADLGAATSALSWTVVAYALGFAAVVLAGVALGDRFGRRGVFLTGLALFTVGSAGCALSPNVGLLIATRAIQGVGGGLAVPLSLVLISEVFPPQQRARAIGIWGAITGMAVAVAPLVGGAIVSGLAWRWIFWVNVPIGVAVLAAGLTRLARSPKVSARIDLVGMLLGAFAVGAIAYAIQEGPTVGWTSAQVLTAGIGGLVLAGAIMAWERRCAYPMVPPGLLANRSFAAAAAGRFCLGVALYGAGFLFPQFLQLEHHYSPIGVGIAFLAWTGVSPFVAPIAGQIAQRRGERTPMVAGMAAMTVSVLALAVFVRPDSSYLVLVGPLLVSRRRDRPGLPDHGLGDHAGRDPGPDGARRRCRDRRVSARRGTRGVTGQRRVQLGRRVRLCGDLRRRSASGSRRGRSRHRDRGRGREPLSRHGGQRRPGRRHHGPHARPSA